MPQRTGQVEVVGPISSPSKRGGNAHWIVGDLFSGYIVFRFRPRFLPRVYSVMKTLRCDGWDGAPAPGASAPCRPGPYRPGSQGASTPEGQGPPPTAE